MTDASPATTWGLWAQRYVQIGWKIIPINVLINGQYCSCSAGTDCGKNAGKHPAIKGWQKPENSIPDDVERIDYWWGGQGGRTIHSMGLLCGAVSGILVLDIDPQNGGNETLAELEDMYPLPDTVRATTGGGGQHIYFRLFQGLDLPTTVLGAGIDVRGKGSQVVLPPSVHRSGSPYTWQTPPKLNDIAIIPEWLVDLLLSRTPDTRLPKAGKGRVQVGTSRDSGFDLEKELNTVATEGGRNAKLSRIAMSMVRRKDVDNVADRMAFAAQIDGINGMVCDPALEPGEVKIIIRSALEKAASDPLGSKVPDELRQWADARKTVQQPAQTPSAASDDSSGDEWGDGDAPSDSDGSGGPPNGLPPDADDPETNMDPVRRTLTENGNARRLVDNWPHVFRYSVGLDWLVWDGQVWRPDDGGLAMVEQTRMLPQRVLSEILNFPMPSQGGPRPNQDDVVTWAQSSRSASVIRKTVELTKSDPRILRANSVWDTNHYFLAVKNGVIDLRTGQLMAFTQEQHITKQTDVEYTPGKEDVQFNVWLDQVTNGDKELQSYLQKAFGYTLTGSTREEKFFLVWGPPRTGKSTVLAVLTRLLGNYALTMDAETFMDTGQQPGQQQFYFMARILGRRMLAVSELPEAERMREPVVKRLTGQDTIEARKPAGEPFEFISNAKLWVATNHRPKIQDQGMWSRMQAIPFTYVPKDPNPQIKEWLTNPQGGLPAVLAWAVEGAVRWLAEGTLGQAQVIQEATQEYQKSEDKVARFFEEKLRPVEGGQIPWEAVFKIYKAWCDDRGEGWMGKGRAEKLFIDKGYAFAGSGRKMTLEGWAVQPEEAGGETAWERSVRIAR